MQVDPGARLTQGRPAAGMERRAWPPALSFAAHGAAIALAVWLAATLRPLPPAASQAGVHMVFGGGPSAAPLAPPGVPVPPQPQTAPAALPPALPPPSLPVAAASPPALPSSPEILVVPTLPSAPRPPIRPHELQGTANPVRRTAEAAARTNPLVRRPSPPAAAAPGTPSDSTSSAASSPAPLLPPRPVSEAAGNIPPAYPGSARRRGQQGRVVLRVAVSASGRALAVTVLRSSGYKVLDTAAADAVQQWRFVPASRGGVPQPGMAEVPVRFQLEN